MKKRNKPLPASPLSKYDTKIIFTTKVSISYLGRVSKGRVGHAHPLVFQILSHHFMSMRVVIDIQKGFLERRIS